MRNGQAWPSSGGRTIGGKSGDRVWVRSTTRMRPAARSPTSLARVSVLIGSCSVSLGQLALERLRIVAPAGEPVLRHVSGIDVLDAVPERLDDGGRKGSRRQLWR